MLAGRAIWICRIFVPRKRLTKKLARRFVMRRDVMLVATHRYLCNGSPIGSPGKCRRE